MTKQPDQDYDSRDRPALADTEPTPEMIKAGEDVMDVFSGVYSRWEMARAIYIAMGAERDRETAR